jgi:hypothetical protein
MKRRGLGFAFVILENASTMGTQRCIALSSRGISANGAGENDE